MLLYLKNKETPVWAAFPLLLVAVLVPAFHQSPPFLDYFGDSVVFHHIGLEITKGLVPYRDVFDHKPPFIYLLSALSLSLGYWGYWLADRILLAVVSLVMFIWLKRNNSKFASIHCLLFVSLMTLSTVFWTGHTRIYTTLFSVICVLWLSSEREKTFFFPGICLGTIFLFQQEKVLAISAFVGVRLLFSSSKGKNLALIFLGFLVPTLPTFLWFYWTGGLRYFYEYAFHLNQIYSQASGGGLPSSLAETSLRLKRQFESLKAVGLFWPLAISLGLFIFRSIRNISLRDQLPILAYFCAELASICVSNRTYGHYYIGVSAMVSLALIAPLPFELKSPSRFLEVFALVAVLISFDIKDVLFFNYAEGFKALWNVKTQSENFRKTQIEPFAEYLEPIRGQIGQLMVTNIIHLPLNTRFEITFPGRFLHREWILSDYAPFRDFYKNTNTGDRSEVVGALEFYQTQYIFNCYPEKYPYLGSDLEAYIKLHYKRVLARHMSWPRVEYKKRYTDEANCELLRRI